MTRDVLVGLAVFLAAVTINFSGARLDIALRERRRLAASNWSVAQWAAAALVFVIAVKESLWFLPLEAAGLWIGTFIGTGKCQGRDEP